MSKNYYGNIEPKTVNEGDIWFTENEVFIAKRKGSHLGWEKKA